MKLIGSGPVGDIDALANCWRRFARVVVDREVRANDLHRDRRTKRHRNLMIAAGF